MNLIYLCFSKQYIAPKFFSKLNYCIEFVDASDTCHSANIYISIDTISPLLYHPTISISVMMKRAIIHIVSVLNIICRWPNVHAWLFNTVGRQFYCSSG